MVIIHDQWKFLCLVNCAHLCQCNNVIQSNDAKEMQRRPLKERVTPVRVQQHRHSAGEADEGDDGQEKGVREGGSRGE